MLSESVVITNKTGLHVRPAALLAKAAGGFSSDVTLIRDGKEFDAKSPLSVMSAAVKQGDTITLQVSGPDEKDALAALCALIRAGIGE